MLKISIIIPVFNAEQTIGKSINSILVQEGCEIELILVDDHSTDGSYNVCLSFKDRYPQINLLKTVGKGVSAARNTGLKRATGNVIGFCDADDYFEMGAFKKIAEIFEKRRDIGIVVTGFFIRDMQGNVLQTVSVHDPGICNADRLMSRVLTDRRIMGSVCNKFFRVDLVHDIIFDPMLSYCEDMHYVMKVLSGYQDSKCWIISDPIYNYILNDESVTHDQGIIFDQDHGLKYIRSIYRIKEDCRLTKYLERQAGYAIVCLAVNAVIEFDPKGQKREKLRKEIKNNIWSFLFNCWRCERRGNIKRCFYIVREYLCSKKCKVFRGIQ